MLQDGSSLICEEPNDQIYKFEGTLHQRSKNISVGSENLLLRGSSLRNTDWIIGFVVYAGHQTKIMMNSNNAKFKISRIERQTNRQIIIVFLVQIVLCLIGSIFGAIYKFRIEGFDYLDYKDNTNWFLLILSQMGTWILIFT